MSFFREACGLDLGQEMNERAIAYAGTCESACWWWPHREFVMACEHPTHIDRDDRGRLHSLTRKAIEWPDGWGLYRIHGVNVPDWLIEHPERITVETIDAERNAEVRRVMLDRFGQSRYIEESKSQLVHEDECGRLYRREFGDDEPLTMVRVVNSTPEPVPAEHGFDSMAALASSMGCELRGDRPHKIYWLRVPPTVKTAREGVAWTFGMTPSEYQPEVQT